MVALRFIDKTLFPDQHFSPIQCCHCSTKYFQCHYCHKNHTRKRNARTHSLSKHSDQLNINTDVDDHVGDQSALADDLSNQNGDDGSNCDDLDGDSNNSMFSDVVNDDDAAVNDHEQRHVNEISDEFGDNTLYNNQFVDELVLLEDFSVEHSIINYPTVDVGSPLTLDFSSLDKAMNLSLSSFKEFINESSSAYFWQNYICETKSNVRLGGIRGIAWRTLYRQKLYGFEHITSLRDARLLTNMTDHLLNNSESQRETFFDILDDVIERSGSIDADVHIPLNKKNQMPFC